MINERFMPQRMANVALGSNNIGWTDLLCKAAVKIHEDIEWCRPRENFPKPNAENDWVLKLTTFSFETSSWGWKGLNVKSKSFPSQKKPNINPIMILFPKDYDGRSFFCQTIFYSHCQPERHSTPPSSRAADGTLSPRSDVDAKEEKCSFGSTMKEML